MVRMGPKATDRAVAAGEKRRVATREGSRSWQDKLRETFSGDPRNFRWWRTRQEPWQQARKAQRELLDETLNAQSHLRDVGLDIGRARGTAAPIKGPVLPRVDATERMDSMLGQGPRMTQPIDLKQVQTPWIDRPAAQELAKRDADIAAAIAAARAATPLTSIR